MATPAIGDFILFVAKPLENTDWSTNFNQVVLYLTNKNYDFYINSLRTVGDVLLDTGNVTLTAGNLVITAGGQTISAGDLTLTAGSVNAGGDITATGAVTGATLVGDGTAITNVTPGTGTVATAQVAVGVTITSPTVNNTGNTTSLSITNSGSGSDISGPNFSEKNGYVEEGPSGHTALRRKYVHVAISEGTGATAHGLDYTKIRGVDLVVAASGTLYHGTMTSGSFGSEQPLKNYAAIDSTNVSVASELSGASDGHVLIWYAA